MVEFSLSSLMLMQFCELRNNVVLLSLYGTLEWFCCQPEILQNLAFFGENK